MKSIVFYPEPFSRWARVCLAMKKMVFILFSIFVLSPSAWASLHLINRETFQGIGTLTPAAPGHLGTVSGTFYKRAVGPKITGDTTIHGLGWSADLHHASEVTSTLALSADNYSPPPNDTKCFDCWIYVGAYSPSGIGDVRLAYLQIQGQTNPLFAVSLGTTSGALNLTTYQYVGATPVIAKLKLNTWYEVRLAWNLHTGGYYNYDASVLYRQAGATAFTTLHDYTNVALFGSVISLVSGSSSSDMSSSFNGRFGMPSLYSLDAFTDRFTLVGDVVDPPTGPFNWYVNPVAGNDNNDGTTPGTAWQTAAKINTESLYCGMFPSTLGYTHGDTLNLNGATGPGSGLLLGTASLQLNTQSLNFVGHDSPYSYIQAEEVMKETWTNAAGSTTIWQCVLSTTDPSSVMWEDDKWLNHPTGTAFSGAVSTYMASTPGSFWTDGTTMYYRPFVASNPNTDGKIKTRSYNRRGAGDSAIQMLVPQLHINGVRCRKTALAVEDTNDPVGAYCAQSLGVLNGASLIDHCYFDYGSKHILGFTDISTHRAFTVRDVVVDQCPPYAGGIPLVDYTSLSGPLPNTTSYLGVSNPHVFGMIGSATGNPTNGTGLTWYSHSGGPGVFSNILMRDCSFAGYIESSEAESSMTLSRLTCGAVVSSLSGSGTMTVDRCKTTVAGITNGNGTCQTFVTNSIIVPSQAPYIGGSENSILGNITFKGCTFDLSKLTSGGANALYTRLGSLNLTMQNCIVLLNQADPAFGFLANATSTDTFALDHNLYQTAHDSSAVFISYNDGSTTADRTLKQLISLKIDQNNSHDQSPLLNAASIPQVNSPAILAGINLNPPINTDYLGNVYAIRATIGAIEPLTPVIATQSSSQAGVVGQSLSLSAQATALTGITYQWQKNGVAIPGATSSTLSTASLVTADEGAYTVTLTNANGSVTSTPIELLSVTSQPSSTLLAQLGQSTELTVVPSGNGPFTYQWSKNGVMIAGATAGTYSIAKISQSNLGIYAVAITTNGVTYTAGPYTLILSSSGSVAAHSTVIHIAGSTAYRSAVHNAILHLMTAGGGTCQVAYAGSSLASANQAVFQGTISTDTGLGTVTVETSWTGSLTGIAGLCRPTTDKFTFLTAANITTGTATASSQTPFTTNFSLTPGPQATGGQVLSSPLAPGTAKTETASADLALSDTFQSSTLFASAQGYPALTDNLVGVIPFVWLKNAAQTSDADYANGGYSRLTNISALQAKYLFGAGYVLASGITGNPADTYFVNLAGRDFDSGTRFDALAEAETPGNSIITQFGNTPIAVTGSGTASVINQTANASATTPSTESTTFPANGGYSSGGKLDAALQATESDSASDFAGYIVGYSGASDADSVIGITAGGPTGYVAPSALTFNGVALTKANVQNGTYSFWTYEHFLTAAPINGFSSDLYHQLLNTDATVAGYKLSDLNPGVSRLIEGGVILLPQ